MSRIKIVRRTIDKFILHYIRTNKSKQKVYSPDLIFTNDLIGEQIFIRGTYELEYLNRLLLFLKSDCNADFRTAIDIGANIGNHTLYFSSIYSIVHSFEPSPLTFPVLSFNTSKNSSIRVHNYALWGTSKSSFINGDRSNLGRYKVVNEPDAYEIKIYV